METIRVGLIRCDLHAYWYAAFISEPVPELFRAKYPENHWLFYASYYREPERLMIPTVSGFTLAKLWDRDRREAEAMSQAFGGGPEVCEALEEVYEDVDLVFIADCFGEGEDHLALAAPALERGIPTFVDKPFARDLKDGREMVRLATERGTPLLSASLLGVSPHADRFRNRFAEVEPVTLGIVRGAIGERGSLAGAYHVLALIQNLFGTGAEWVECMGEKPLQYVLVRYENGTEAIGISSYVRAEDIFCGYRADVYGKTGVIHSSFIGDFQFPYSGERIFKMLREMVRTGRPPMSYQSMLELVAIAECARLAQEERRRVFLHELMKVSAEAGGEV